MKSHKKETFASIMYFFGNFHDQKVIFDDFLQMSIAACAPNPKTGKSFYEEEYLQIIGKYEKGPETEMFGILFGTLVDEMTQRQESQQGFDVLGEFFETSLIEKANRKNQFFTPWPICQFMAQSTIDLSKDIRGDEKRKLRILDPACGSGRMLMAASRIAGSEELYFGVDIDPTCIRMTILNLFLSGVFHGEAMCANALIPDDFKFSYRTRLLPYGIWRVEEKDKSLLWNLMQTGLAREDMIQTKSSEPPPWDDSPNSAFGDQLRLL